MKINERIRSYIESNGMRMSFVAEKSDIEQKRFYRLMNGTSPLSADEFERICAGLGVKAENFFADKFLETRNELAAARAQ